MVGLHMLSQFLRNAVERHLDETMPIMDELDNDVITKTPFDGGRPLGEVILHMLRSIEFYLVGLSKESWEPLPYSIEVYNSADKIKSLAKQVFEKAREQIKQLVHLDLQQVHESFNRRASTAEILLEMIEHSIHHRGQITVYYRLLGKQVPSIAYII
ncbi:MAG: DinB family protein [Candidatus Hodarchaeota archaeon]